MTLKRNSFGHVSGPLEASCQSEALVDFGNVRFEKKDCFLFVLIFQKKRKKNLVCGQKFQNFAAKSRVSNVDEIHNVSNR